MRSVCDATERVVANVTPAQFGLPTPCTEWDVQQLANHVLATLELGRALLSDTTPAVTSGPGEVPAEDLIGSDLLASYRSGAAALVTATTDDAVSIVHLTPIGEMPGVGLAGFVALDVFVHGWDLAKATGQEVNHDPDVADRILGFAWQAVSDDLGTRAPRFGTQITVADDADPTTRLVAFLGRQP